MIAEFQHIYYDEFLPKILSSETMAKYKLASSEPYTYDEKIDGSMANEFLIAYR